ncbi:MAG: SGNH/GDSL hydrolase family protein [Myxococcales bacterium]|nr:SGNH/GDSL hydrolase family protein [Myxococcales bacterium]
MTAPDSPSKKSHAGSLVSGLVSTVSFVLIVLVLLEGLSRLFLDPVPEVRVAARVIPKSTEPISLELEGVPDRGGLYQRTRSGLRLRPQTHAVLKNERLSGLTIDIRTNSLGYRGPEIDAREGTRILFLGDSITFANYLPEEETFVHLTRVLGAAKGHSWNTINAGVGTISLGNELAILKETGISVEPDVVVLAFYLNDFHESPGIFVARIPKAIAWSRVVQHVARIHSQNAKSSKEKKSRFIAQVREDLARQLNPAPGNWRINPRAFDALILKNARDWGGAWSDAAWTSMVPLFEELKRLSDEHGFQLAIVAFPVRYQVLSEFSNDWPQQQLAKIAKSLDVPLLDLLPSQRRAKGALYYDHCHHSPRGARLAAVEITEFLATQVLNDEP